jgi:hypothetical protein
MVGNSVRPTTALDIERERALREPGSEEALSARRPELLPGTKDASGSVNSRSGLGTARGAKSDFVEPQEPPPCWISVRTTRSS